MAAAPPEDLDSKKHIAYAPSFFVSLIQCVQTGFIIARYVQFHSRIRASPRPPRKGLIAIITFVSILGVYVALAIGTVYSLIRFSHALLCFIISNSVGYSIQTVLSVLCFWLLLSVGTDRNVRTTLFYLNY